MPYLTEDYYLNFYGGEPLLAFELIKQVASFLETQNTHHDKKARYSLTTNGSLLSDEIIQFLDKHEFSVELSYDGLAQDAGRKKGSKKKLVPIIRKLLNQPNIGLEINSVFTPATVDFLSKSIQFILEFGISDISCSISTTKPWSQASLEKLESELTELRKILDRHFQRYGHIPVVNFRDSAGKGIFHCAAGQDRLAIDPDGGVWGCFLFADHLRERQNPPEYRDYFFGDLANFMKNHKKVYPRISSNYTRLRMDNFKTPRTECFLCKEHKACAVCPVNAALSGIPIGQIPNHICEIQKIIRRTKEEFRRELQSA